MHIFYKRWKSQKKKIKMRENVIECVQYQVEQWHSHKPYDLKTFEICRRLKETQSKEEKKKKKERTEKNFECNTFQSV